MKQFFRGSVLVYTLFILMMLLVSGLALATVTLMQQRGASGLGDSVNAFQAANDGFEDLIAKYKATPGTKLSNLGSCTNVSGVGTISQSVGVGGRGYTATFKRDDGSGTLVDAACGDNLSDIEQVKVVATVGSSTRAIETAFATGTTGRYNNYSIDGHYGGAVGLCTLDTTGGDLACDVRKMGAHPCSGNLHKERDLFPSVSGAPEGTFIFISAINAYQDEFPMPGVIDTRNGNVVYFLYSVSCLFGGSNKPATLNVSTDSDWANFQSETYKAISTEGGNVFNW